ncbi:hypothetical protein BCR41DRAFT_174517 [Lobosporangium transversale]|uniref:sn-1-specific diacylglycerol lipase n=1 Tax=Lobosporangium transversale TaxID=64571 RepID=A0A1Y2GBB2_9FUNG|nr:hypothetical protein BCR41DRAFT_174517 [Lobosporangium transversale]ORZ05954.1 hypothetical protein BCR41DRAFT_174517 [Lobosporangium transversale]|eukprot:XP_021877335.1 hypothetical protein BCR41DRAFT_174517 [Lobosporangium transversale]
MTFDTLKIDVYDVKKAFNHHVKIGRAYLPLRDLQKKVGNKYDSGGNNDTEPGQSILSSRFDATTFCRKHDDVFEFDLPLFKHGSYSKFGSISADIKNGDILVTKGSENGKDISTIDHRPHPTRSDSFAQQVMNGVEVGMVTVQVTMHFKDQTHNLASAQLKKGVRRHNTVNSISNAKRSVNSSLSLDSSAPESSCNKNGYDSDLNLSLSSSSDTESRNTPVRSLSAPIPVSRSEHQQQQCSRILQMPSSPPNLLLHYGTTLSAGSPLSPPLSPTLSQCPGSPSTPLNTYQWLSDNNINLNGIPSWDESELSYDDDAGYEEDTLSSPNDKDNNKDQVKGEHPTEADRKQEEELMAGIMANGDQAKKDLYLSRSTDRHSNGKDKKPKFKLFSEQTRSAFKDIQLIYSSFFGHGWNLTRGAFWRGFHIVEQYYARHPTPTTNRAFNDIEILEKARHFVRLAIASYGSLPWVYFGYSFKVAPLNFVRFNSDRKNVMDYFKLKKEDMIIWHFDKRTALVPSYYIIRDPKYNALCIIIRGTFSITDAMTDLVCEYYPYKGGLVHKGIMDNARFVLERSGKDIEAALRKFNLKTIYCIGHSLGAGSSSLLCSLLQDHFADYVIPATSGSKEQKLEIKAYLFAPPPICTPNLAAEWERTQIAFINESDIVCRLSYGNALDLKELIKIAALESLNPAYKGLDHSEKMERILEVLEKAQKSLRAVDDVPRLVIGGTVTYLHKVYEDTPVIQNKRHGRDSKFGLPENWLEDTPSTDTESSISPGRLRGMSTSSNTSNTSQSTIHRSLSVFTSAFSIKSNGIKHHRYDNVAVDTPSLDDKSSTNSGISARAPKVMPYQPNQAPVRLASDVSLVLSDLNGQGQQESVVFPHQPLAESPQELPSRKKSTTTTTVAPTTTSTSKMLGDPILYEGPSNARDLATQHILSDSHQGKEMSLTPSNEEQGMKKEEQEKRKVDLEDEDGELSDEDDIHKVYTTQKPRINGSKKKEIRIEFSDKENFMSIPLRTNWLWHHFPQQYDSRIERALAWAKAHKEKEECKQQRRSKRDNTATMSTVPSQGDYFSI